MNSTKIRWSATNSVCFYSALPLESLSIIEFNPALRDFPDIRQFDPFLGPYPLIPDEPGAPNMYHRWLLQTTYITPFSLKRLLPGSGKVSSMTSTSQFSEVPGEETGPPTGSDKGKGPAVTALDSVRDMESLKINFTNFDLKRSFPPTASGPERTKYSLDKSWLLEQLIRTEYEGENLGRKAGFDNIDLTESKTLVRKQATTNSSSPNSNSPSSCSLLAKSLTASNNGKS